MASGRILRRYWRVGLYPLGVLPAGWLIWQGQSGALGADPINALERSLGLWAFRFLLACLALAPLRSLTGVNLLRYRRLAGLLAFFYALLHLTAYVWLDQGFDWQVLWADITRRPFLILGMGAFLLLLPLAFTSNLLAMRYLKRGWKRLHMLIFPAALLAAVHFYLSFKTLNDISAPYLLALGLIFLARFIPARSRRAS